MLVQILRLWHHMYVCCRAMPDELAGSGSLQEIDVGFNALTAMPTSWVQEAKCSDGCPEYNISAAPIAYIGIDSNAIAVRPSHVGLFFLELVCRKRERMQQKILVSAATVAIYSAMCVCVEDKEVSRGSAINSCHDVQGSFPEKLSQAPNLIVLRMDNNNLR